MTPRRRGRRLAPLALGLLLTTGASEPAVDPTELSLWDLEGEQVVLADRLSAETPTVVLFWSLYQPDSRRALHALDEVVSAAEGRLSALAVEIPEYREGPDAIRAFLERAGVALPVLVDPDGAVRAAAAASAGGGDVLPLTFLYRADASLTLIAGGWNEGYAAHVRRYALEPRTGTGER